MNYDRLGALTAEFGLAEFSRAITSASQYSIRLVPGEARGHRGLQSRLGGLPDVPPGFVWPEARGTSLGFVGQIHCAELAKVDKAKRYPLEGLLSFFYHGNCPTVGASPTDAENFRVFYFPGRTALAMHEPPDDISYEARWESCPIQVTSDVTLPSPDSEAFVLLRIPKALSKAYARFWEKFNHSKDCPRVFHRMGGHPEFIQGDQFYGSQLVSGGVDFLSRNWKEDPRVKALAPGWKDWELLLQVDSEPANGMCWGDGGRLYFTIRTADLAGLRFDRAWLTMDCY